MAKEGKWAWIKGKFPMLQPESSYQDKVNQILNGPVSEKDKRKVKDLPTAEVEANYNEARRHKEDLDDQLSAANLEVEVYTQLIYDRYEDEGVTSKVLKDGTSLGVSTEPYPMVIPEKKDAFLAWVREQGMGSMLTLPYQTMAKVIKERLETGEMLPPGVDVYCRNKLTRRGGKKENS